MTARASSPDRWDERIARAGRLAERYPAAADILTFYGKLAGYQQSLAARWAPAENARASTDASRGFRFEADATGLTDRVLEATTDFLAWLDEAAPPGLADAVVEMRRLDRSAWRAVLDDYLGRRGSETAAPRAPRVFVVEALLQPLAEQLAGQRRPPADRLTPPPATGESRCPFCDDRPLVGVLREEGEGAKRSLVCGLCLTEWPYLRLVCPACGERRFEALPVFTSEQVPGARVEACDTCRGYLKTIDLTQDGHAVPCVDDLATVSLDLWARDQGYTRVRSNLLMT